jgi:flagellin-specific chaperone FliS
LARDASIEVVRQVANNRRALKMFKNSLILEMIARDVSVAADIADNLSKILDEMREEIIQALLQHADPKVVETAQSFVRDAEEIWEDDHIEVDEPD